MNGKTDTANNMSTSQSPSISPPLPLPGSLNSAFVSTPNRGSSISNSSTGQSGSGTTTINTSLRSLPSSTGLSHKDSFGRYDHLSQKPSVGQKVSIATPLRRTGFDGTEEGMENEVNDETVDLDNEETELNTQDETMDTLLNTNAAEEEINIQQANKQTKIKNGTLTSLSNPPTPTARNASLTNTGTGNNSTLTAPMPSTSTTYFDQQGQSSPSGHVAIARSPFTQPQTLASTSSPDAGHQSKSTIANHPAEATEETLGGGSGESPLTRKSSAKAFAGTESRPDSKDGVNREKMRRPSRQLQQQQDPRSTNGNSNRVTVTNGGSNTDSPSIRQSTVVRSSRSMAMRNQPQLPCAEDVKPAPPPAMYWSKVPVHGSVPRRSFRAHSGCLADEILWLFGGCDSKGCFRDLWCFDTETMCWSKPKVTGDLPPARRAHSATMVDKRLFVFAGGDGPYYFNDLYVFDTVSLRWTKPDVFGQPPSPRRAHTSNYYNGQLIIFGGGNGVGALNDVYSLDLTDFNRLEWRKIECRGKIPIGRGYHTSNLVDGKLIVIGGSDGHMSFNDIHILKLDTKVWYQVKTDESHNRLGHTATQVGSYLFIVGGHNSHNYTPDILTLNLVNLQWEPRNVCGKKPPGRGYHQAWLRDSRLFVHGGFDGKEIFDDLYYIDLSACAYLPQITSFSVELDDE